jgi:hypothetical protein
MDTSSLKGRWRGVGGENERTIELVEEDDHLLGVYAEVSDILPEAH